MTTIANQVALAMVAGKQAVLVDVREPAEYRDGHLPAAVNVPSTQFEIERFQEFADRPIFLVCQTGRRAGRVAGKLEEHGISNVFLLEQQMAALGDAGMGVTGIHAGWSIDRQFRMALSLSLAVFLIGFTLWSSWFIVIPIILCIGLFNAAVTDNCYLRMGIAMLPWNQRRTSELPERNAYHQATLSIGDVS